MDQRQRNTVCASVEHAGNQLRAAREHLARCEYAEAVQAAQQTIEVSVKAVLSFLEIDFPLDHEWDRKAFSTIAKQIPDKPLAEQLRRSGITLPRLIVLANLWAVVYLPSKYGIQTALVASPQDLFRDEEAQLAVRHAAECHFAATMFRDWSQPPALGTDR